MCGLVGMAGDIEAKHDRAMRTLLVLDSVRGEDSTGIAAINKFTGATHVAKSIGDPFFLFQDNKFTNLMNKKNKVFIGHNRYATSGGVSKRSAHPFEFDTLVGAHNGTLGSKNKLLNHEDFKVDSENLYHHIEELGLQDAITQLGGYGNAWALTWFNKDEQTVNFLRNKERPLFFCWSENAKTLFWASEPWMLDGALGRHDIKRGPISLMEEDVHYSVYINDKAEMDKPVLAKCAAPAPVVYNQSFSRGNTHTSQTSNSNVVKEVGGTQGKKEIVVAGETTKNVSYPSACDSSYLNSKAVQLETLSIQQNKFGAKYVICFDAKNPTYELRLYFRKADWVQHRVGDDIRGDITAWCLGDDKASSYYKVNPWSVEAVPAEQTLYPLANGQFVDENEWKKLVGSCAYCSSPLQPATGFRFTTEGDCFCDDCSKLRDVKELVKFK